MSEATDRPHGHMLGDDPLIGRQPIDWQARATAAEAENAKLREALQPFAALAAHYDPEDPIDDNQSATYWGTPTIGQLRRARAAIEESRRGTE